MLEAYTQFGNDLIVTCAAPSALTITGNFIPALEDVKELGERPSTDRQPFGFCGAGLMTVHFTSADLLLIQWDRVKEIAGTPYELMIAVNARGLMTRATDPIFSQLLTAGSTFCRSYGPQSLNW